jgi:magnesium chelatase accessory protein
MSTPLNWETDGRDWPHREASRFVSAGGLRWHVQVMGRGPVLLLVHGTGAASHSWRDLMPLLAPHFTVVAPDLPGHGFSAMPPSRRMSLPGMADALHHLLAALALPPEIAVGHSAGAAIAARLCLDGQMAPRALVSLNGALLPPSGLAGLVFMPSARLLALNPLVPRLVAWTASDRAAVQRLIDSTGSRLDARGAALYRQLVGNPAHVAGTLTMMARWDLAPLLRDLPRLKAQLTLVVGENDRTVSPREADQLRARVPALAGARVVRLPGLGHLAHEQAPDRVAAIVLDCARRAVPVDASVKAGV